MYEVKYLCNGWVKKNGVNANLMLHNWRNFRYPIDFAFSPRVNAIILKIWCRPIIITVQNEIGISKKNQLKLLVITGFFFQLHLILTFRMNNCHFAKILFKPKQIEKKDFVIKMLVNK